MLQLKHHKAMWCNGHKFHIKRLDDKMKTPDCGITALVFKVTNVSSRSDRHPEETENRYYGHLEDIIQCDFNSYKIVLFEVKWYKLRMHERDPERIVIENTNCRDQIRLCRYTAMMKLESKRTLVPGDQ